jgi:aspartate/glutamate racemase
MGRKIGMVHAMSSNPLMFKKLTAEIMPEVEFIHLVDEGLPYLSDKTLHPQVVRRLGLMSSLAKESGAEMILITCTAFGRLADDVQKIVAIPVMSVLEIVATEALKFGDNIGILGSHLGAISTAAELLREEAVLQGRKVEINTVLCEGAFEAFKNEDWTTHDRIILKHLKELMKKGEVKVIVAPQPSCERVVDNLSEADRKVPVISSARLSVKRLKEKLDTLPSAHPESR